jgi:hypothetical protein
MRSLRRRPLVSVTVATVRGAARVAEGNGHRLGLWAPEGRAFTAECERCGMRMFARDRLEGPEVWGEACCQGCPKG